MLSAMVKVQKLPANKELFATERGRKCNRAHRWIDRRYHSFPRLCGTWSQFKKKLPKPSSSNNNHRFIPSNQGSSCETFTFPVWVNCQRRIRRFPCWNHRDEWIKWRYIGFDVLVNIRVLSCNDMVEYRSKSGYSSKNGWVQSFLVCVGETTNHLGWCHSVSTHHC